MGRLWELYRVSFLLCQSSSSSSAILSHHSFFWDSFRRPTIRSGGLLHIDGLPKCGLSRVMLASHLPQRLLQDPDTAMTAKEGTESSHFDTPPKSNPTRIDKLPRFRHRHYLTRRARRREGLQFAVGVCFIYHRNDFPPSFDNSLVAIFVRNKRKKRKTAKAPHIPPTLTRRHEAQVEWVRTLFCLVERGGRGTGYWRRRGLVCFGGGLSFSYPGGMESVMHGKAYGYLRFVGGGEVSYCSRMMELWWVARKIGEMTTQGR
ncbi:uncharacterized protein LY79DRAFT_406823 [Colletotrichum navitas]|uniref:Uncharacterized protein n=1 Tax=Colletotrichum navitas TaxID=681940 RepID=A0AAD8Q7N7_9PEZI|nr:uncharacterized protein LY79DRAFT_406823 [Colletotrichum navitas]KAK1597174.1 hypothetical protein LY79DRAFT_406823 [Colletotrichum navitas]